MYCVEALVGCCAIAELDDIYSREEERGCFSCCVRVRHTYIRIVRVISLWFGAHCTCDYSYYCIRNWAETTVLAKLSVTFGAVSIVVEGFRKNVILSYRLIGTKAVKEAFLRRVPP